VPFWRDQTSSFAGIGKNTAWATWKVYDEITSAFVALSSMPIEDRLTEIMPDIERFVALMYDRTSTRLTVNEARKDLFTKMAHFFTKLLDYLAKLTLSSVKRNSVRH